MRQAVVSRARRRKRGRQAVSDCVDMRTWAVGGPWGTRTWTAERREEEEAAVTEALMEETRAGGREDMSGLLTRMLRRAWLIP
jgi:hypothetical protein